MSSNAAAARLRRGLVVQLGSPVLVELALDAGFDFLVLDLEHGLLDMGRVDTLLGLTTRSTLDTLVRMPFERRHDVGRILDAGADGIVLAHTESVEQLEAVRSEMMFPPDGRRGAAPSRRAVRWGDTPWPAYQAATHPALWALLESREGVAMAGEIASSGLVDAIWLGLYDLALSEGWDPPAPGGHVAGLEAAIESVAAVCRRTEVEGVIWLQADSEQKLLSMGFDACYVGTDAKVIFTAYAEAARGSS